MYKHVCTTAKRIKTNSKDAKINKNALAAVVLFGNAYYAALGIYDWLKRNPIGISNTQTISKIDIKSGLLFSGIVNYSSEITSGGNSWLNFNISDKIPSGVTLSTKSLSISLGYQGGNFTVAGSGNYTKNNSLSGSVSIGLDGVDASYVNSFSHGDVTIGSGAGVSLKTDLVNGILGMYHTSVISKNSGGITKTDTTNTGFQTLNGLQGIAILSLAALIAGNPQPIQQIQQYPVVP